MTCKVCGAAANYFCEECGSGSNGFMCVRHAIAHNNKVLEAFIDSGSDISSAILAKRLETGAQCSGDTN